MNATKSMKASGKMIAVGLTALLLAGGNAAAEEAKAPASQPAAGAPVSDAATAAANGLVPVKTFRHDDLIKENPTDDDLNVWVNKSPTSSALVIHDKWVYAASTGEYVLQFERDPNTGGLEFRDAVSFEHHDPEAFAFISYLFIARSASGKAFLYLERGAHNPHLHAVYAIDPTTGKLTLAHKMISKDRPNPFQGVTTPDQKRVYSVSGKTIAWYKIEEDGSPSEEGKVETKIDSWVLLLSPDGRHLYTATWEWHPANDNKGEIVNAYALDATTGKPTFVDTYKVDLDSAIMTGFSPDGKHLYLNQPMILQGHYNEFKGDLGAILERDPDTGALKVVWSGTTEPALHGITSTSGGDLTCQLKFTADGTRGVAIGNKGQQTLPIFMSVFTRDPKTGKLTVVASVPAYDEARNGKYTANYVACKLAMDPKACVFYTVGWDISSYKLPAAGKAEAPQERAR